MEGLPETDDEFGTDENRFDVIKRIGMMLVICVVGTILFGLALKVMYVIFMIGWNII